MILKTDGFELEIAEDGKVYLGSPAKGQTFLNWSEIDDNLKIKLEEILLKAENLIRDSESLFINHITHGLQGRINNAASLLKI